MDRAPRRTLSRADLNIQVGLGIFTAQVALDGSTTAQDVYRAVPELAAHGERAGFGSVWVSEHHFAGDSYLPAPMLMLAAIAARTERVLLGTAAILAPFHDPIRLAEDAAVLDLISGGRLLLGLGLGWWEEEFRVFGRSKRDRVKHLIDAVEIIRGAAFGDRFSYEGRSTQVTSGRLTPAPMRHIPVWLGGTSPPALARAGRLGDGFIASRCSATGFEEQLAAVDEGAREVGRMTRLPAAVLIDAWYGTPDDAVVAGVWASSDVYSSWRAGLDTPDRTLALPHHDPGDIPPLLVHGDPAEIVSQLGNYVRAAGDRDLTLCLRLSYPGVSTAASVEAIRRVGAEVLPLLQVFDERPVEVLTDGSR